MLRLPDAAAHGGKVLTGTHLWSTGQLPEADIVMLNTAPGAAATPPGAGAHGMAGYNAATSALAELKR